MRPLSELGEFGKGTAAEFCARFDHPFLVHCRATGDLQPVDRTRGLTIDRMIVRGSPERVTVPTLAEYSMFEVVSRTNRPDHVTIGCSSGCDVQVNDTSVSKVHASLRRTTAGWSIHDEESLIGIRVNDEEGSGMVLRSGDRVSLGSVDLVFMMPTEMHQLLKGLCRK